MRKEVYIYWGDIIISPKMREKKGFLPVYEHKLFKQVTEDLIFSKTFINEFEKEIKSDLLTDILNEQVFYYWTNCWFKRGYNKPCGLSEENAKQLIKYFEFILGEKQKGKFRIVVTKIAKTCDKKTTEWYEKGRLD